MKFRGLSVYVRPLLCQLVSRSRCDFVRTHLSRLCWIIFLSLYFFLKKEHNLCIYPSFTPTSSGVLHKCVIFQQIFFRHEKALVERNAKKRIAGYTFLETSSIFQFHRSSVSRLFLLSSVVYFTTRFIFATIVTMIRVFMARSIFYTDGIP